MSNQNSPNRTRATKENKQLVWYKEPTLLIQVISIIASAMIGIGTIMIGIISIVNSSAIGLLDKEFYVPSLQYHISQKELGEIILDIFNNGRLSADNLTIAINWNEELDLRNCQAQPPFQDTYPIKPFVNQNLTYKLPNLARKESFELICEISSNSKKGVSDPESSTIQQLLESTITVDGVNPTQFSPLPTPTSFILPPLKKEDFFNEILITNDLITVDAIAENSDSAKRIIDSGAFLVYKKPITSLFGMLSYLQVYTPDEFINFCNNSANDNIFWYPLKVKEFSQELSFVPLENFNQILIKVQSNDFRDSFFDYEAGTLINLYGRIKSCDKDNGLQIWIKDAYLSLRGYSP